MARKHGRETVVYVDGFDVSGDSNSFEAASEFETVDTSGFGQQKKTYTTGLENDTFTHAGWFDNTPVTGIHAVLQPRQGSAVLVCAAYGASQGDMGVAGSASLEKSYGIKAAVDGAEALTINYQTDQGFDFVQVLNPKGNIVGSGVAKNDGAGSNAGIRGYLQRFSVLGGTPVIAIQHGTSPAPADFNDLISFAGGTVRAAQALSAAGTVRQYLRVNVTGGSAVAWVGYRRL